MPKGKTREDCGKVNSKEKMELTVFADSAYILKLAVEQFFDTFLALEAVCSGSGYEGFG